MRSAWSGRFAVLAYGMLATAAWADVTYTFNVPVEFHQWPTALANKAVLFCKVQAGNELLAESQPVEVALDAGGNASGSVAVPVTLGDNAAMRASRWHCRGMIERSPGRGYDYPQGIWFQPAAGSSPRLEVQGELNQAGAAQ